MKTKEFVKKVESLGYTVVNTSSGHIFIRDEFYNPLIGVDTKESFVIDTSFSSFKELKEEIKEQLINLVLEYVKTPIEEREEPEKYRLKLPLSLLGFMPTYVFYNRATEQYFIDDDCRIPCRSEQDFFTQREIDAMPNQEFIKSLIKEEV